MAAGNTVKSRDLNVRLLHVVRAALCNGYVVMWSFNKRVDELLPEGDIGTGNEERVVGEASHCLKMSCGMDGSYSF